MNATLRNLLFLTAALSPSLFAADKAEVKFYGIVLPKLIGSSGATSTFGRQNMTAITSAAPNIDSLYGDTTRLTWQLQQTRFGMASSYGAAVQSKIELDFIDFSQAQAISILRPRLRLAEVDFKTSDMLTVTVGQGWDIINADIMPYTNNLVGSFFQAGNVGFLRQHVVARMNFGDLHVNVSAGGVNQDTTNTTMTGYITATGPTALTVGTEAKNEASLVPVGAITVAYNLDEKVRVGVGFEGSSLQASIGGARYTGYVAEGFFAGEFGMFGVRAKGYYGQNLSSLDLLSLSGRTSGGLDVQEWGFFVAGKGDLTVGNAFVGFGMAQTLNQTASNAAATAITIANTTQATPAKSNMKINAGYEHHLGAGTNFYAEYNYYSTDYFLPTTVNSIHVLDFGINFKF